MYHPILALHNTIRWIPLIAGVVLVIWALTARIRGSKITPAMEALRKVFVISIDTQFLLGIILYIFLSPVTQTAFSDFKLAMSVKGLRYFAVEHIATMVLALVGAHVMSIFYRRATTLHVKQNWLLFGTAIVLALIIAGTPWFRPLLPHA